MKTTSTHFSDLTNISCTLVAIPANVFIKIPEIIVL